MDKRILKQYGALQREIKLLEEKIDKLYDQAANIPVVLGKVVGSSRDFPYTEVRTTVQMDEPKESDAISRLLRIKKARLEKAKNLSVEIEEFIAGIPDSTDRQVLELIFLEGKKQREVAEVVGYSRGRIPQIITKYIKD